MGDDFQQDIAAVRSIKAIPTILDIVCRTTGMRFAAVARVTEQRWIACSVRDDIAFGLRPGGELKVEETICHEIRQSGEAVIIDHVAEDPAFRSHHTPRIFGLQSYISMPIRLEDGSFFGTLCAIDPEPHLVNTPETVAMFRMFADVIGIQLSAIDRMNRSEAALHSERETSALREQFIAVLGHDLRNPLTSITGGARMLLREPQTERAARLLGMIQGSVNRMAGLIDNVMDFARGRLGGGIDLALTADVALDPVLRQVVDELRVGGPDHVIHTDFSLNRPVACDPSRIAQMVSNLLGNALTHGDPRQPVAIHASTDGDDLSITVVNGGPPISSGALERLFQPFVRGDGRASQQGLGLGLHIASEIAKAHGGTLSVISSNQETRFTFRMPAPRRISPPGPVSPGF